MWIMGYRLGIIEKKESYYGTKLFGYEEHSKLESFKYLMELGKVEEDDYFDYSTNQSITLSDTEFREFIKLYNEDLNNFCEFNNEFINDKEIQKLMDTRYDKILEWG